MMRFEITCKNNSAENMGLINVSFPYKLESIRKLFLFLEYYNLVPPH